LRLAHAPKANPSVANRIKTGDPTIKPLSSHNAVMTILPVLIEHGHARLKHLPSRIDHADYNIASRIGETLISVNIDLVIRYTVRPEGHLMTNADGCRRNVENASSSHGEKLDCAGQSDGSCIEFDQFFPQLSHKRANEVID
jgi:hypothetical protein